MTKMEVLAQALEKTEKELKQERASALGRAGQVLEALLGELERLGSEIAALPAEARAERVAQFNEVREKAKYRLWCLIVQRETVGIRQHRELDQYYRLPPAMK